MTTDRSNTRSTLTSSSRLCFMSFLRRGLRRSPTHGEAHDAVRPEISQLENIIPTEPTLDTIRVRHRSSRINPIQLLPVPQNQEFWGLEAPNFNNSPTPSSLPLRTNDELWAVPIRTTTHSNSAPLANCASSPMEISEAEALSNSHTFLSPTEPTSTHRIYHTFDGPTHAYARDNSHPRIIQTTSDRFNFQYPLRETLFGFLDFTWRDSRGVRNDWNSDIVPPKKHSILKKGWLWKLSKYSDVFCRQYTVLLVGGDLLFYNKADDIWKGKPIEAFKAGYYSFPEEFGMQQPRRFEVESRAPTETSVTCLVAPSVAEKINWVELLLTVLVQTSSEVFKIDDGLQTAIRISARTRLSQIMIYTAPFFIQELVQAAAPQLIAQLAFVALAA